MTGPCLSTFKTAVLAQWREQVESSIDEIEALTQRAEFDRLSRLLDVLIPQRTMMKTKSTNNIPVKVTLNLRPGQLSPAQQRQWDRAWQTTGLRKQNEVRLKVIVMNPKNSYGSGKKVKNSVT